MTFVTDDGLHTLSSPGACHQPLLISPSSPLYAHYLVASDAIDRVGNDSRIGELRPRSGKELAVELSNGHGQGSLGHLHMHNVDASDDDGPGGDLGRVVWGVR